MKKLSELSIADLYTVSDICLKSIRGRNTTGEIQAREVYEAVADELASRIAAIHHDSIKSKR